VIGNEVRGNGRDGIHLQEDFVTGNSSDRNLVQGNQVGRNARDGIQVNGENNRILNNTSLQNTGFDLFDRKPDCDNNTWSGNVFGTAEPVCTTRP
jgi:hypothetical protein